MRTLAHAAGLIREARTLSQYGIAVPALDYPRLLGRVREIVSEVVAHSSLREQIDSAGVTVYENAGTDARSACHTGGLRGRRLMLFSGHGHSSKEA